MTGQKYFQKEKLLQERLLEEREVNSFHIQIDPGLLSRQRSVKVKEYVPVSKEEKRR